MLTLRVAGVDQLEAYDPLATDSIGSNEAIQELKEATSSQSDSAPLLLSPKSIPIQIRLQPGATSPKTSKPGIQRQKSPPVMQNPRLRLKLLLGRMISVCLTCVKSMKSCAHLGDRE